MTEPNHNAYPQKYAHHYESGLTLREYFAALAMQGQLANPDSLASNASIAKASVSLADALIAELNKQ